MVETSFDQEVVQQEQMEGQIRGLGPPASSFLVHHDNEAFFDHGVDSNCTANSDAPKAALGNCEMQRDQ